MTDQTPEVEVARPEDLLRRQDSPAAAPDTPPIVATGDDLADGTTHGVEPGGTERDLDPDATTPAAPSVGIGGATSGEPPYDHDPALPPGRRPAPRADS